MASMKLQTNKIISLEDGPVLTVTPLPTDDGQVIITKEYLTEGFETASITTAEIKFMDRTPIFKHTPSQGSNYAPEFDMDNDYVIYGKAVDGSLKKIPYRSLMANLDRSNIISGSSATCDIYKYRYWVLSGSGNKTITLNVNSSANDANASNTHTFKNNIGICFFEIASGTATFSPTVRWNRGAAPNYSGVSVLALVYEYSKGRLGTILGHFIARNLGAAHSNLSQLS